MDIIKQLDKILGRESGIADKEVRILYELAKKAEYPIIEFGALRGRSAISFGLGSKAGNKVRIHSIEPFAFKPGRTLMPEEEIMLTESRGKGKFSPVDFNVGIFNKHMREAGVHKLVKSHVGSLYEWEYDAPVSIVFVDAEKQQAGLRRVWDYFWPKIVKGGWFISHDFKLQERPDGTQKFQGVLDWFREDICEKIIRREVRHFKTVGCLLMIKKL